MQKRIVMVTLVVAAVLAAAAPALAAADTTAALDYLKTQQNADGGFGSGFSPDSSLSSTADAVLAIVAAGGDLAAFDKGGNTPLTYLAAQAPSAATGGDLAKLILAATAAGENPRQLGGVDSVAKLEALIGANGRIGAATDTFFGHCLAVLALKSAERPIPAAAVDLIKIAQQDGGGWAWDGSAATAADTNTTAVAVQALVAAGEAPAADSPSPELLPRHPERRRRLALPEPIQLWDGHRRQLDGGDDPGDPGRRARTRPAPSGPPPRARRR